MALSRTVVLYLLAGIAAGCASGPAPVSPAEIDDLAARLQRDPTSGPLQLRYAAALRAADRCDDAMPAARRGMGLSPADALGPLVLGECLEAAQRYDDAIAVYGEFVAANPDARGADAVRSRELLATRASATQRARQALAHEAELSQEPGDPQTVAVLPIQVVGDSMYEPLSRGLAQMLTSDLALLQRFRMVERMRLGALLDEMALAQTQRVDPATAARVGRLVQAGRMVQGLAMIRNDRDARLEASVVEGSGEVTDPTRSDGTLRDLLQLEKDVVIGLADRLGYVLSEAERAAILENGTRNLTAFLAYSRALDAEDRGDYQAAARYYRQAIQADPNFSQARDGLGATAMMADVQAAGPADAPVLAGEGGVGSAPAADAGNLLVNTINSTVADVASTTSEQTAGTLGGTTTGSTGNNGTGSTIAQPPPPSVVPPVTLIGTIRIIFRLP